MRKKIDPREFGLHHATHLEKTGENDYAIVIDRKSRIVMKDGQTIQKKADKIKASFPQANVILETTAPVCSKTRRFLAEQGVEVQLL